MAAESAQSGGGENADWYYLVPGQIWSTGKIYMHVQLRRSWLERIDKGLDEIRSN